MTATIIRGDARRLPLPDACVDLIVTSPPYFALRSYQDAGEHYAGQIGSEPIPAEFLDALIVCTWEMMRVLKPSGSLFINLGDKYSGYSGANWGHGRDLGRTERSESRVPIVGPVSAPDVYGIPNKSLMGLPWRYALRCIDQLGLILRAEIVWEKLNPLPESAGDRVKRSHEQWFHFSLQPRYYSAIDMIREPHVALGYRGGSVKLKSAAAAIGNGDVHRGLTPENSQHPLGKLPASVWSIASQPLTVPKWEGYENGEFAWVWFWTDEDAQRWQQQSTRRTLRSLPDHFAAFPMAWPRRLILGWSPSGICTGCGEGRRPVAGATEDYQRELTLRGKLVETRRREPSANEWRAITEFIQTHRVKARLSRQQVSQSVVGTPSGACWWWENEDEVRPPTLQNWRRLKEVLSLPDTWDHLLLDTYMRPTGELTGSDAVISGRHRTSGTTGMRSSKTITGEVCACPDITAPTRPARVLDPFGGTGTVALVADVLGRHGITADMSADYSRLARWRCNDPGQRAAALQVEKPEPVIDGQLGLFEGVP